MERTLALAGLILFLGGAARAQDTARAREAAMPSAPETAYEAGVDQYARGRFSEALAAFEGVLRRDPRNRAARIAAERVRAEIAMAATARPNAAAPRPPDAPWLEPEDDGAFFSKVVGLAHFERTVGEEREREGRLRAMQGRIAQLVVEKRVSRAQGRSFLKDAELHALSRRLS
jgi:tetratricopeptide (TPR) repeat protein